MIDRRRGEGIWIFGISCSTPSCEHYAEFPTEYFVRAVELAKQAGWLIKKVNDEWQHFCVSCRPLIGKASPDKPYPDSWVE